MSGDGDEPLYVKLPPSLKFLVDEEDDSNKGVVIAALEQYFGVSKDESEAVIRRKIKRKEQRFESVNDQLEEARATREQVKGEIERLRDILEAKEGDREEYRTRLDDLLDDLATVGAPKHLFPEQGDVREIAREFDRTPDEVLYDLKDRAVDQPHEFTNTDFMDTYGISVEEQPLEDTFDGGGGDE